MYLLLLIWGFYFVWYLFVIIFPNSFDRISEKTLREQRISYDSKLRYVYINKKVSPQLKCIASQTIIFFVRVNVKVAKKDAEDFTNLGDKF